MKLYSTLFVISLVISTMCLGMGFVLAENWLGLPVVLVFLACWVFSARRGGFWPATCALVGDLVLAVVIVRSEVSAYLPIAACVTALSAWELILFKNSAAAGKMLPSRERHHLRSLGLASLVGLLASFITTHFRFDLPFGLVVLLGLATMAILVFGIRFLQTQIKSG